jgi:hypothetical protein
MLTQVYRSRTSWLWDGTVKGWNEADYRGQRTGHAASGHWGVPTFVFENELSFGQDRIDLLIWRMQSKGLTRRS